MRRLILLLFLLLGCAIPQPRIDPVFCRVGDCEARLLTEIRNATRVACAFYDLDLKDVRDALAQARVKLHNRTGGLMHHKFCILDGDRVVTGSMNPTENGVHKNDNVLLVIHSEDIARAYAQEFEHLEERTARGVVVGNVQVCFSPQQDCEGLLLREIRGAEATVRFLTFTFTSDPVGSALLDAADRGVSIQGVFERRQQSRYSEYERLREWGLDVTYDENPYTMHHKAFIIDGMTVVTGSYNPTWSARYRNDENLLVIHDPSLARAFQEEFDRIRHPAPRKSPGG